jgi:hypothetical protein
LVPHQWFEQSSIVTVKSGMWEARLADEENEPPDEDPFQ